MASFGNYGSLVSYGYQANGTFGTYSSSGCTWMRMKLDPDVVHALILDQYGLAVTDPRSYNPPNARVFTKEQSSTVRPRLYIKFASTLDTTPPGSVSGLTAEPGDPNWNEEADHDSDGDVDVFDVITVINNFGSGT